MKQRGEFRAKHRDSASRCNGSTPIWPHYMATQEHARDYLGGLAPFAHIDARISRGLGGEPANLETRPIILRKRGTMGTCTMRTKFGRGHFKGARCMYEGRFSHYQG